MIYSLRNQTNTSTLIKWARKWLCLPAAAFFVAGSSFAQQIDGNALLDLLVKKGVLTSQEASNLQKEVSTPAPAPAASSSSAPMASAPPATSGSPVVAADKKAPLSFKIGIADFYPVGFMDFTTVYRTTNVGSGIGTNFAGIPFNNTSAGQLSETRFSAQNSRIGLRIESTVDDAKVMGYLESDFLGNAPTNLGVSSNAATLRMRLYFADVKIHDWEFLAGQDWTMLTPNKKAINPLPGDIFFTMNMDTNYQAGLVWSRQPQIRAIYHASDEWTVGLSVENPDQYVGGTNGTPSVTLPAGFSTAQVDTGAATSAPNVMPDFIGKVAFDTKINDLPWHMEVAGLYRSFKVNTYATGATPINVDSKTNGVGAAFNVYLGLTKELTFVGNAYWSRGGGRYIFGQAPDFIVRPQNDAGGYTISSLYAASLLTGLEYQATPTTQLFGYYSTVDIGRSYSQLSNGTYVGYGYNGSPNSNNHRIDEYTLGGVQTLWKNPSYGALQIIAQASYVDRKPWYVAPGSPSNAHSTMVFADVRYTLP